MHSSSEAKSVQAKPFSFTDSELQAFQAVGQFIAQLGNRLEKDPESARGFLEAAITADRETLIQYCDGVRPSLVGPMKRLSAEMGVREASCQLRFDLGSRFRFILGVEEQ